MTIVSSTLLKNYALDHGFHDACVLSSSHLLRIYNYYKGHYRDILAQKEKDFLHYFHIPLLSHTPGFTLLLCALSCYRDEPDYPPGNLPAQGVFAPFARRNYYAEAVRRLKAVFKDIREATGMTKKEGRIFCNSRAPEKFLVWASGLGGYGKNSLIIHNTLGSVFVIAGLLLFLPVEDPGNLGIPALPGSLCSSCMRCIEACPVRAIRSPGIIDQTRCIQALSTRLIILPDDIKTAFGSRIYGCQICQDVCPYNKNLTQETPVTAGEVGPWIPLALLLDKTPPALKEYFKKTVPGASWIDKRTLQRNALLAAGNQECGVLLPLVKKYCDHPHPALADAAAWAAKRLEDL
jgi:epoxyqueuosine reductase